MQAKGQSIFKPDNDIYDNGKVRANEDALRISDKLIAISDGAGGTGILADKWADLLVKMMPDSPFKDVTVVEEWIAGFWEGFYNEYVEKLKGDPWKIKKFEEEGSSATLLGLWNIESNKFVCQTYGDTVFFIYNPGTGKLSIQENMKSVNSFTINPPLVSWQDEHLVKEEFKSFEFELQTDEKVILATDGMAIYIHGAYLTFTNEINEDITDSKMERIVDYFRKNPIEDFNTFIAALEKSVKDEKTFHVLTSEWHKNRALPNDDHTLVFVE